MYGVEQLALARGAVLGHLPGVAARALQRLELEVDRLGAHRADLLGGGRAHVVGLDHRAEPLAVAIACRPATPAPRTTTSAGWTVPAAVMFSGKNRRSSPAATIAQR